MTFNLLTTVGNYLTDKPEQRFTTREIAKWIFETYPAFCKEKKENSKATVSPIDSDNALIQQIAAEIATHRPRLATKFPGVKTTDGRPRLYYFSKLSDETEAG